MKSHRLPLLLSLVVLLWASERADSERPALLEARAFVGQK
jgi:hypothetical protein